MPSPGSQQRSVLGTPLAPHVPCGLCFESFLLSRAPPSHSGKTSHSAAGRRACPTQRPTLTQFQADEDIGSGDWNPSLFVLTFPMLNLVQSAQHPLFVIKSRFLPQVRRLEPLPAPGPPQQPSWPPRRPRPGGETCPPACAPRRSRGPSSIRRETESQNRAGKEVERRINPQSSEAAGGPWMKRRDSDPQGLRCFPATATPWTH